MAVALPPAESRCRLHRENGGAPSEVMAGTFAECAQILLLMGPGDLWIEGVTGSVTYKDMEYWHLNSPA